MRKAARKDANQDAIVAALRQVGCYVYIHNAPDHPDLTVVRAGVFRLLEVKSAHGKLQAGQNDFMNEVNRRVSGTVVVVRSVDEALEAMGLY